MQYVLSVLFYLPVAATHYVNPLAGVAVSSGFLAYHFWTRRVQKEVVKFYMPMDIDNLEMSPVTVWDSMEVVKDD